MLNRKQTTSKKGTEILWNVRTISQRTDEILDTVKESRDAGWKHVEELNELAVMNKTLLSALEEQTARLDEHSRKIDKASVLLDQLVNFHQVEESRSFVDYFRGLWQWMIPSTVEIRKSEQQMNMLARAGMHNFML